MCATFRIKRWLTPVQRADRAHAVLRELGMHDLREACERCFEEVGALARKLGRGLPPEEHARLLEALANMADRHQRFNHRIRGALASAAATLSRNLLITPDGPWDAAIRRLGEVADEQLLVSSFLAPFLVERVAEMRVPGRVQALHAEHPHLRTQWPFNPRMPRLITLDPLERPPEPPTLAQRLMRVFLRAGAPEEADASDFLYAHLANSSAILPTPVPLRQWEEEVRRVAHATARQRWSLRIATVVRCREQCDREKWGAARVVETREWEVRTLMACQKEGEAIVENLFCPLKVAERAPTTDAMARGRLVKREYAAELLRRAMLCWLYAPGGPMALRLESEMVELGVVGEPAGLPDGFEEVEDGWPEEGG